MAAYARSTILAVAVVLGAPAAVLTTATPAVAVDPSEQLDDPALEARAREISKRLRCVTCGNQSIDESNALAAVGMRRLVRERLIAGDTDEEVVAAVATFAANFGGPNASYEEYVLLMPRFSWSNLAIWIATPLALMVGAYFVWRKVGPAPSPAPGGAGTMTGGAVEPGQSASAPSAPIAASDPPPLSEEERRRLDALMARADPDDAPR